MIVFSLKTIGKPVRRGYATQDDVGKIYLSEISTLIGLERYNFDNSGGVNFPTFFRGKIYKYKTDTYASLPYNTRCLRVAVDCSPVTVAIFMRYLSTLK